jgi:HlyD family secretion protein
VNVLKQKSIWRIALFALIIVALGLAGCNAAQRAEDLDAGDIATAFIGDLAANASATGRLLPDREARLALGIAGQVERVYVEVGDEVTTGQILVELEMDNLQRAVQSAEQNLAIKQATLAEMMDDPDPEDLAAARAAVTDAQAQLDDLLDGPTPEQVAQAEAAVASAQARLQDLQAQPTQQDLDQAQASLVSAKANLASAQARYEALDDQLVVAQNDIDSAQLNIDAARDAYNALIWNSRDPLVAESWGPYTPQAAAKRIAEINYQAAVANYKLTEININDSALRGAKAQVAQAEAALAELTKDRHAQIAAVQAQLAGAQANLANLIEPKPAQIAAAKAQLAQAEANLAALLRGASEEQVRIAQAQVEQAQISLEEAHDNLANAQLSAPFDGTITAVHVAAGERAAGLAIEMVDTSTLRVVLDMDEIDIGAVRVGQPAIVTLETWPERELQGEVIWIAPKAQQVGDIVTYEVDLSLDAGDLPIRTGMTANADLITAQRTDVLLIPNRAVIADRQESKYYANKLVDDETVQVEISIGLRDSTYTEVRSGLNAGDQVVIGTSDNFSFGQGPPSGMREMGQ